jgi:Na+/glutamate symporter
MPARSNPLGSLSPYGLVKFDGGTTLVLMVVGLFSILVTTAQLHQHLGSSYSALVVGQLGAALQTYRCCPPWLSF